MKELSITIAWGVPYQGQLLQLVGIDVPDVAAWYVMIPSSRPDLISELSVNEVENSTHSPTRLPNGALAFLIPVEYQGIPEEDSWYVPAGRMH